MTTYAEAIALTLIDEAQSDKADTANQLFAALSSAALFGIQSIEGLNLTLYGGIMIIAGVPTAIATQTITLTASATNYVKSSSAGVFSKVTSAPSGWPGPLSGGDIALYQIVTSTSTVTIAGSTCYVPSLGPQGDAGPQGEQGPDNTAFQESRIRLATANGGGATTLSGFGFSNLSSVGTPTARTLSASSLRESIPYIAYVSSSVAGSSAQLYPPNNYVFTGNAAGRGGFTVAIRFLMESASAPANQRCFYGLFPVSTGSFANAEPDTFINIMGVGSKAGEANLSLLHNDGSGTATKTLLVSDDSPSVNFPARATDNVYELLLTCVGNTGIVSYALSNISNGTQATGTITSNMPANTTFLSPVCWMNNGSTAAAANLGFAQMVVITRY